MNKKKILFISKGEHAASTRYRSLIYFNALRENGWKPTHLTLHGTLSRFKLLRRAAQADVIVILRKTFSIPYLFLLRLCSKHIVFDFDDAIFYRSNGSTSLKLMRRFAQVTLRCQQIWAGNEYLAEAALRYNTATTILPTSLEPQKYAIKVTKPNDTLDLVWIGSGSTRRYIEPLLPLLEQLIDRFPFLRLKIVADFDLPSEQLPTVAIPWSEKGEAEALVSAHIGIAPMPDNSWTRGKCGLKVLQYMAAGLPVVSSPVGVNKNIVEHGVTGFLAESPGEWRMAIERLIGNSDLRRVMGKEGQKRVTEGYAIDVTLRKMIRSLESMLSGRDRSRKETLCSSKTFKGN
jgi:glycosyltransferase involved in cell wall biosynthesis